MKITRLCYVFAFIFFCTAMASCSNPTNNEIPSSEMNVAVQNELHQMLGPLEVGQRGAAQPAQEQGPVTKQAGPSLLWPAGPLASTATPFSSFLFKLYTAIR